MTASLNKALFFSLYVRRKVKNTRTNIRHKHHLRGAQPFWRN